MEEDQPAAEDTATDHKRPREEPNDSDDDDQARPRTRRRRQAADDDDEAEVDEAETGERADGDKSGVATGDDGELGAGQAAIAETAGALGEPASAAPHKKKKKRGKNRRETPSQRRQRQARAKNAEQKPPRGRRALPHEGRAATCIRQAREYRDHRAGVVACASH